MEEQKRTFKIDSRKKAQLDPMTGVVYQYGKQVATQDVIITDHLLSEKPHKEPLISQAEAEAARNQEVINNEELMVDMESELTKEVMETNDVNEEPPFLQEDSILIKPTVKEVLPIEEPKPMDTESQLKLLHEQFEQLQQKINSGYVQQPQVVYVSPQEKEIKKPFGISTRDEATSDDLLESPVTYLKTGRGFVLSVYTKKGKEYKSPYNVPLRFKYACSDVRGQGNAEDWLHYCEYTTWYKKECYFIENSSLFGVSIFKNIKQMQNMDPKISAKLDSASRYIDRMSDASILSLANSYGIDRKQPIPLIKDELRKIEIQKLLDEEKSKYEANIISLNAEKMFRNNKQE